MLSAEQQLEKAVSDSNAFSKFLRIVSFPISAFMGFTVARLEVRDANRQAMQDGSLKDIIEARDKALKPLIEARVKNEITEEEFMRRDAVIRRINRQTADERIVHMGRRTFMDKFNYVPRSVARKAIMDGMTVAGIALGVMLTVSDSQILANLTEG